MKNLSFSRSSKTTSLVVALATLPLAAATPQSKPPPNIIFILSDDHAWQAMSAYGDERKLIDTPNLDRIARNGMRFDRCLVTNSICSPSRATILTGAYSHINGAYDNPETRNTAFDGSQVTFPKLLQKAGYQTAMIGKWHLESDPTGFDFWKILIGHGLYFDAPMILNGEKIKTTGYVSDVITDATIDWLKHRDKTKPFALMSWHKAAHRAWFPDIRDLDFDNKRTYAQPPTLFDDYAGRGPAERNQKNNISKDLGKRDLKLGDPTPRDVPSHVRPQWDAYYKPLNQSYIEKAPQGKELVDWKYQRYMHDYLATVRGLDESVGKLLDYLEKEGLLENTIIVYSSDQGFFLGEHGWFDKRWFYEESLRTPLVISWPGVIKPGSVNTDIVSNLDFAPTFLEAAGAPIPERMQGRSLVPLFKGEHPADWRRSFYYQYYEDAYGVPPHYGIVTDRYKLMHIYSGKGGRYDYWEMFDLQKDPRELKSVFNDPAYAQERKTLESELARLRVELNVPENDPNAPVYSNAKTSAGKAAKSAKAPEAD